jgi:hypothetical protein
MFYTHRKEFNVHRIFLGKLEGKRPFGRHRRTGFDCFRIGFSGGVL